jgi:hypothetical protein
MIVIARAALSLNRGEARTLIGIEDFREAPNFATASPLSSSGLPRLPDYKTSATLSSGDLDWVIWFGAFGELRQYFLALERGQRHFRFECR